MSVCVEDNVLAELLTLLKLEKIEKNIFLGQSQDLGFGSVFGGQVLGQALSAAYQTVPPDRRAHSLHAYFLRPGIATKPIVYDEVGIMKIWLSIPVIVFILLGCVFFGEERVKTFTAHDVTEENVFSYGSVFVKVNPDLQYLKISGDINIEIMGKLSTPTQKEFHIFTRPELNRIVMIETHTRKHPHTFEQQQDLTKNMATIQKGKKPIDGRIWDVYVRAHPRFPEQILNAVSQKGVQIPQYRCGLEIGVGRVINRFNRIYVSYLEGIDACNGLPQNGSVLTDIQIQMIREFASQFDANITISDQSGGS